MLPGRCMREKNVTGLPTTNTVWSCCGVLRLGLGSLRLLSVQVRADYPDRNHSDQTGPAAAGG